MPNLWEAGTTDRQVVENSEGAKLPYQISTFNVIKLLYCYVVGSILTTASLHCQEEDNLVHG